MSGIKREDKYGEWKISKAQRDYIALLSGYTSTEKEDKKDISDFLGSLRVDSIEELTKKEAHALIIKLLERSVEYTFLCGLTKWVHKQDYNKYTLFGEMEACMHDCPDLKINSDVNNCPAFIKWHDAAQDAAQEKDNEE